MISAAWWRKITIPAVLFGIVLAVYVKTLCPTVYWEDAGELITVAHVLGIAHPPGHPLYTIIAHLFSLIPLGSIAWRVNLMSAVFAALAAALVYPASLRTLNGSGISKTVSVAASAAAALFAAFGATLWDQSVVAETSGLHTFFFMTLLLLFFRMVSGRSTDSFLPAFYLFSFVYGLSLTNHVAGVFLMPAFALWAAVSLRKEVLEPKRLLLSLVFFLIGLGVYLYLPLRSIQDPIIDWGNPETLSNFWWVVTAGQFRSDVFEWPTRAQVIEGCLHKLNEIRGNYLGIGIVFIIIGSWACARRQKPFLLFGGVAIGTLAAVTMNPAFIPAYFIPALLLLAIVFAAGAAASIQVIVDRLPHAKWKHIFSTSSCVAILMLPLLLLFRNYPMNDRSRYYLAREYGEKILAALPENAAFFTIDVNAIFTIWYLQYCEDLRRDVLVIEPTWLSNSSPMRSEILRRYPQLLLPEEAERISAGDSTGKGGLFDNALMGAILEKNSKVRPVYWGSVPAFDALRPVGLVYEYAPGAEPLLDERSVYRNRVFWEETTANFRGEPSLMRDRVASQVYPEHLRHQALYYSRRGRLELARWAFDLALQINPAYAPVLLGFGELLATQGREEEALAYLNQAGRFDSRIRPRAHFQRGVIYYEASQNTLAAEEFRAVLHDDFDFPGVHNYLGSIYLADDSFEEAEEEFRTELKLNPSTPGAYPNMAQILLRKGQLEEAERLLEEGMAVQPQLWQNYYFLGKIYAMRTERAKAMESFSRAIELGGMRVRAMVLQDKAVKDLELTEAELQCSDI
ncbi:MAG: DUF2723 domain-containing protein [Candidatus Abyssobacteria bacterium SURF_5]|uniref:DUF2723 domain-containing protein n=1 Tax=Abyssobacteria bacterium (strain SURF_5) TaxID=2093360 RepID=A0A3A4P0D6_ABYX5|nr:MAG: DUF2723 domain-containing protein [Candidatus Abyssubacteria bacterium SURF_5]